MNIRTLTFKGGTHPPHSKSATEKLAVEPAITPKIVVIPMQQNIGAPCSPVVKVGDEVKVGQKLGEPGGFVGAPIHSSVSGKVLAVELRQAAGGKAVSVVIENDEQYTLDESIKSRGTVESLSGDEIKAIVKEAGIVGMGGATFPTHVKLAPPPTAKMDTVILNGAECEPYLTADHRLMLERPERVIIGLKACMKALGVNKGFIGIEENKPDAIETMYKAAEGEESIEVVSLKTKYPQGAEKQLIFACTGREVPSGKLPSDVGVLVDNVGTAAAIADAIIDGMPLIMRNVTITGDGVKNPKNLLVRVGTSFQDCIDQCGGFVGKIGKVISGGPMMGVAQFTTIVPVTKGTSGILTLTEASARIPESSNCMRCGKCVSVCPMRLLPFSISAYSLKGDFDTAERYDAMDCIECGSCSFVCPAKRHLCDSIRLAKNQIGAKRRKAQAEAKAKQDAEKAKVNTAKSGEAKADAK